MQELAVALGVRIIVRDVDVCLRIVVVHLVVPSQGIDTSDYTTIEDRQFPVFAVVDLSAAWNDQCQPQGTFGIRSPFRPVFFAVLFLLQCRVGHSDNHGTVFAWNEERLGNEQRVVLDKLLCRGASCSCQQQCCRHDEVSDDMSAWSLHCRLMISVGRKRS